MRVLISLMLLSIAGVATSPLLAEEPLNEAEAIAKIESLGGTINRSGPVGLSVNLEPKPTAVVPFWAIVIPLTLLSACLLLSKQPSSKLNGKPH